tara:strand:+ start:493 stop:1167 length:675 start_codon:yes stop_codon:yes gene_type:complete
MAFAVVGAVALGAAALKAGTGIAKSITGTIQAKKAAKEQKKAQEEMDKNKALYASLDTSNPYLDMENTMEDLTVNQDQAEFTKQQQEQQRANIMEQMKGAAGSSGIAALAQSLANQGSLDAQKASVSIGKQEQANQLAERKEASRIQGLEREGELISRQAEFGKVSSLLGMSADEVAAARQRKDEAIGMAFGGVEDVADAGMDYASSKFSMETGGTGNLTGGIG